MLPLRLRDEQCVAARGQAGVRAQEDRINQRWVKILKCGLWKKTWMCYLECHDRNRDTVACKQVRHQNGGRRSDTWMLL